MVCNHTMVHHLMVRYMMVHHSMVRYYMIIHHHTRRYTAQSHPAAPAWDCAVAASPSRRPPWASCSWSSVVPRPAHPSFPSRNICSRSARNRSLFHFLTLFVLFFPATTSSPVVHCNILLSRLLDYNAVAPQRVVALSPRTQSTSPCQARSRSTG